MVVYTVYACVCVCAASDTTYVLGALRHNLMCAASGNALPRRTTLGPRASLRLVHRHRLAASTYVSCSAGSIPRGIPGCSFATHTLPLICSQGSCLPQSACRCRAPSSQLGPTVRSVGLCAHPHCGWHRRGSHRPRGGDFARRVPCRDQRPFARFPFGTMEVGAAAVLALPRLASPDSRPSVVSRSLVTLRSRRSLDVDWGV